MEGTKKGKREGSKRREREGEMDKGEGLRLLTKKGKKYRGALATCVRTDRKRRTRKSWRKRRKKTITMGVT